MGKDETLKVLADWTDRIAKGEVPPTPPRPTGIERNIVSTLWDVGDDHSFMHDQISTDKHQPDREWRRAESMRSTPATANWWCWIRTRTAPIPSTFPRASRRDEVPSRFPAPNRPSLLLGQRASVVQSALRSGRSAQPDARQQGPRVDDLQDPRQTRSGLVQRSDATSTPPGSRCSAAAVRPPTTIRRPRSSR